MRAFGTQVFNEVELIEINRVVSSCVEIKREDIINRLSSLKEHDVDFFKEHVEPLFFEVPKTIERKFILGFLREKFFQMIMDEEKNAILSRKPIKELFNDIYEKYPFLDPNESEFLYHNKLADFNSKSLKLKDIFSGNNVGAQAKNLIAIIKKINEDKKEKLEIDFSDFEIDSVEGYFFELFDLLTTVKEITFTGIHPDDTKSNEKKEKLETMAARNRAMALAEISSPADALNPWDDYFFARIKNRALINSKDGGRGVFNLFEDYQDTHFDESRRALSSISQSNTVACQLFEEYLLFLDRNANFLGDNFPYQALLVGQTNLYDVDINSLNSVDEHNIIPYLTTLADYLEANPKKFFPFSSLKLIIPVDSEVSNALVVRIFKALKNHPEVTHLELSRSHLVGIQYPYENRPLFQSLLDVVRDHRNFSCLIEVPLSESSKELLNVCSQQRRQKEIERFLVAINESVGPKRESVKPKKAVEASMLSTVEEAAVERPVTLVLETEVATEVSVSQVGQSEKINSDALINREKFIEEFCGANSPYREIFYSAVLDQCLPNFPLDSLLQAVKREITDEQFINWVGKLWDHLCGNSQLEFSIKNITEEAYVKICTTPQFIVGGISVDALPLGFYIENKVLCYDALRAQGAKKIVPLISSWEEKKSFKPWLGDASQFVGVGDTLNPLFEGGSLSPSSIYSSTITWIQNLVTDSEKKQVLNNLIFADESYLNEESVVNYRDYFEDSKFNNSAQLYLLANIAYRLGKTGLNIFLENIEKLEKSNLLENFLLYGFNANLETFTTSGEAQQTFQFHVERCGAVEAWCSPDAFVAMREITTLTKNEKIWWKKINEMEFFSTGFVDIASVYKGFRYFLDEINKMGLVLSEDCPIQGPGPLTQLSNLLVLLHAVPDSKRQEQFSTLVTANNDLPQTIINEAEIISRKITEEGICEADEVNDFFNVMASHYGYRNADPLFQLWIETDEGGPVSGYPTPSIIANEFLKMAEQLKPPKSMISLASDAAVYAVLHDGFSVVHPAMQLLPSKLFDKNSYRVSYDDLLGLQKDFLAPVSRHKPLRNKNKSNFEVSCHRFLASSGRELNSTYQLYDQFIQNLFKTHKEISVEFAPLLMMVISGRRGANAFSIASLNSFLEGRDANKIKKIIAALNIHPNFEQLIKSSLISLTLNELLGLMDIIYRAEPEKITAFIDQLIGTGSLPSSGIMESWELWYRNKARMKAGNFSDLLSDIKTSQNPAVSKYTAEWSSIAALLNNSVGASISLPDIIRIIPEDFDNKPIYPTLLSLLSRIDLSSLNAEKLDLTSLSGIFLNLAQAENLSIDKIIDEIQSKLKNCQFVNAKTQMQPPLYVKVEKKYWEDFSAINDFLKHLANTQSVSPELDYFENVEATQKELPTIVQLYRFALRIKQHKELILQEYRALALDLQANFSDVGQLSKEGVVDRVPFAGTPASIRAMFEDTVKALFQDKLTLIEAQFPQDKTSQNEKRENYSKKTAVFEKLKNLFPQPVFPEIKIADKPISPDAQKQYEKVLADYQANCQAVEKIYSVALMLHRKWPTQFNLDLVLDKIQKLSPRLTAYEFGSMLSVIQGIDAVYLPSELFTLFDSKNFPQCISVVVDVMEFHHVSLQDKIRIAQAVLQSPNNAPAVYFLPTLLENYKDKPQLCEGISELFFKNINEGDIGNLMEGVNSLLQMASCDEVREKILTVFSSEESSVGDLRELINSFNSIDTDERKKQFLDIITYGILDADYLKDEDVTPLSSPLSPGSPAGRKRIFSGDNALIKDVVREIEKIKQFYHHELPVKPGLKQLKILLEPNKQITDAFKLEIESNPDGLRDEHIKKSFAYQNTQLIDRLKKLQRINHLSSQDDYLSGFYADKLYCSVLAINGLRFGKDDKENVVTLSSPLLEENIKKPKSLNKLTDADLKALALSYRKGLSSDLKGKSEDAIWIMRCEFLAIACEALYRVTKKWPNEMQITSVLTHMMAGGNAFSEIPTGAGKSIINSLLAMMQWCNGCSVDICTSSVALAKRDYEEHRAIYAYLGIKTSSIDAGSKAEEYLQDGINFSEVSQLSLYEQKHRMLTLEERKHQRALILDEADLQVLAYSPSKQVSQKFHRGGDEDENPHEKLYDAIFDFLENHPDYRRIPTLKKEHLSVFKNELKPDALRSANALMDDDLLEWLNAALTAQSLREGKDYLIQSSLEKVEKNGQQKSVGRSRALIINPEGGPEEKPRFGKYVHQFLHAYLNRKMQSDRDFEQKCAGYRFIYEAPGMRTSTETVRQFVRGYDLVWGNTGTLGGRNEARRLNEVYHAVALRCPSYYEDKLKFIEPTDQSAVDDIQHLEAIYRLIVENQKVLPPRPLLLFCKDLVMVQALENFLMSKGVDKALLQSHHAQAELMGQKQSRVISKAGNDGMITLTTTILGRGTDFHTKHPAGFRAVITSANFSQEQVRQMGGRSGRKGHPGTYEFLVKKSELAVKGIDPNLTVADKIKVVQVSIAKKSEERLTIEERYADILHQYWEDFLKLSRELKERVSPSQDNQLWKAIHAENQKKLGEFFEQVERKYVEMRDKSDHEFQIVVSDSNLLWEKTVADIKKSVRASSTVSSEDKEASVAVSATSKPRELVLPIQTRPLEFVSQPAGVQAVTVSTAREKLPFFNKTKQLLDANDLIVKRVDAILQKLNARRYPVPASGFSKKPTAVGDLFYGLLRQYCYELKQEDVMSSYRQQRLINLRSEILMLLQAVKEYPDSLKEEKDKIQAQIHKAFTTIQELEKNSSSRVQLELARYKNALPKLNDTAVQREDTNVIIYNLKAYAEKEINSYLKSRGIASDRRKTVDQFRTVFNGKIDLPGMMTAIIAAQKDIAIADRDNEHSAWFFKRRNITSSRLMDALNAIATKVVAAKLKVEGIMSDSDVDHALIGCIVNRQKDFLNKNILPPDYQTVSELPDGNASNEKLIQIREQLISNIGVINKKISDSSFPELALRDYRNLLIPTVSQLDAIIALREQALTLEERATHVELMQTYQRIYQARGNVFNTKLLAGLLSVSDPDGFELKDKIKYANKVMDWLDSNRDKNSLEKIDQGSPALVALVAELCQLNKLIKNSVAYKTGAYKAHEEWLNAVRKNTLKLLQGVWSIDSDPLPKQPGGAFLGAIRSVGTHFNVAAGIEKPTMAPRN